MSGSIVITGHLGGIGSAITETFLDAGYRVIGIDKIINAKKTYAQIGFDLSSLSSLKQINHLRDDLLEAIGSSSLSALINNAAVQHLGEFQSLETELFHESWNTNVIAPLNLARMLLPSLEQSHGTVVNVNSIHATLTKPGFAPDSISKAAMAGLTRAMAVELGRSIHVIEVRQAAIATPMLEAGFVDDPANRERLDDFHPTGSIGTPENVSEIVRQIVETEATFLNGAVINIDGGISRVLHDPG